jgi:hypothetical protein
MPTEEQLESVEWYGIYVDDNFTNDVGGEHATWEDAVEAGARIARAAARGQRRSVRSGLPRRGDGRRTAPTRSLGPHHLG